MKKTLQLFHNDYKKSKFVFEKENDLLMDTLQRFNFSVEHIGSTSIPNTLGKGVIDLLVICEEEQIQKDLSLQLSKIGYIQGELDRPYHGRLFFSKTDNLTGISYHLNLVVHEYKHMQTLRFRDYMRTNPNEVEKYNQEKLRLAEIHDYDRHMYVVEKEAYVLKLMKKIEA